MSKIIVFVGVTAGKTAIADSFLDLISAAPAGTIILHGPSISDAQISRELISIKIDLGFDGILLNLKKIAINILKLRRLAAENEIILFSYSTVPINSLICMLIRPSRYCFWCHDPSPHSGESFYNAKILPLDFKFSKKLLKPKIFCGSLNVKNILNKTSSSSDVVVYQFPYIKLLVNSCKLEDFSRSKRSVDFVFFGRFEPYKGIADLFDALILLDSMVSKKINFVFAGRGDISSWMRDYEFTNISISVRLSPSNSELADLLVAADACVLPYTDATGSQVLQTALMFGCRAVVSDISLFREIADELDSATCMKFSTGSSESLASALCDFSNTKYLPDQRRKLINYVETRFNPFVWSQSIVEEIISE